MPRGDKTSTSDSQNGWRSFLSLVIFVHLFIVIAALLANVRRSAIERRLLGVLAPYVESLAFVGPRAVHFYTHGDVLDDDHFLEIEVAGKVERFPGEGTNWSADRRRGFRYAQRLGHLAEELDDNLTAELARNLAAQALQKHSADKAVVRCKRRLTQPLHLDDLLPNYPRDDGTSAAYDKVIYEADIFRDEDGNLQVAKRSSSVEVAPRQGN